MKILWKLVGGILPILVLVLLVLRVTGFEPPVAMTDHPSRWETRPGLWLKGEPVTAPVTDWSFTDQYSRVKIQARTWYLLPHSVTVTCTSVDGRLYLTSAMAAGVKYPNGASWHRDVARDPRLLLKIGDKLYKVKVAYLVTDPVEHESVAQAKIKKYPPYGHTLNRMRPPKPGSYEMELRVISDPD